MASSAPLIITKSANVVRGPRIPGVFPSARFGEQVLSTGVPSLDSYIGGGIPLGSICLIKDSFPGKYSDLILKCFVAEGASYNHNIYVASGNVKPQQYVNELPILRKSNKILESQHSPSKEQENNPDTTLRIAWRYQSQGSGPPAPTRGKKEAKFDFSHKCTATDLGGKKMHLSTLYDLTATTPLFNQICSSDLINEIANVLKPFEIPTKGAPCYSNVVRVAISHCEEQILSATFMHQLRALITCTNSCAVISVSNLATSVETMSSCENFADYVITLQAVFDERRKSELGDIDGICEFVKIESANSIKPIDSPQDIGFSFKKKRLIFQELHLPPDGESSANVGANDTSKTILPKPDSGCGTTIQGKSLDF